MAKLIAAQAMVMLLLILIGMLCYRIKLLSKTGVKELSALVLKVVNPVVILLAYQRTLEWHLVRNLFFAFLLSAISFVVTIFISSILFQKKQGKNFTVELVSTVYSNCGFMGIPLVNALLGYEGVFYLTAYITLFNLFVWTHGVAVLSGTHNRKAIGRMLCSPALLAIAVGLLLFFTQISLPTVLSNTLTHIGNMNTPLAMLAAGATIAQTNLRAALKKRRVYWICFCKLIFYPAVCLAVFLFLPLDWKIITTVVIATAAPTAITCTLQCMQFGQNALYASELFAITTILSVLTLPAVGGLLTVAQN